MARSIASRFSGNVLRSLNVDPDDEEFVSLRLEGQNNFLAGSLNEYFE